MTAVGIAARSRASQANAAWEALLRAHNKHMRAFAAEDIWGDVSMREYDVLYTLTKCEAPLRLSDLARYTVLSQPALSRLVDRLVERGLVHRSSDADDHRSVRISLTDKGAAVHDIVKGVYDKHVRTVEQIGGIAADDFERMNNALLRLERFWTDQIRYKL